MNDCSFLNELNNFLYLFCKTNGFIIFLGPFHILEYCKYHAWRISRMCQSMVTSWLAHIKMKCIFFMLPNREDQIQNWSTTSMEQCTKQTL